MIEYVFGLNDLARVRFAISPSLELAASLQALRAPSWPRIKALLDADLAARARHLAETGAGAVLGDLHPSIRWDGERLAVRTVIDRVCELEGRGLLLVPSAFSWTGPSAIIGKPWQ